MSAGERTALFSMVVSGRGRMTELDLTPVISMDGGGVAASALDVPRQPRIVEVSGVDGETFLPGSSVAIGDFEGSITVRVTIPDDCAVGLKAGLAAEPSA